ncbi:hypothetical protein SDC9_201069 [bioreactor metagenome]|uniref:Uncharacterized protein n=1 Tax=bioreactor metagenome TaxID=1076179 RepID=A0A645IPW9_9ZZZZ
MFKNSLSKESSTFSENLTTTIGWSSSKYFSANSATVLISNEVGVEILTGSPNSSAKAVEDDPII